MQSFIQEQNKTLNDFPHLSSDADVDNGVNTQHLSQEADYQEKANELYRKTEDLLSDAAEWLELYPSDKAEELFEAFENLFELMAVSTEKTA